MADVQSGIIITAKCKSFAWYPKNANVAIRLVFIAASSNRIYCIRSQPIASLETSIYMVLSLTIGYQLANITLPFYAGEFSNYHARLRSHDNDKINC